MYLMYLNNMQDQIHNFGLWEISQDGLKIKVFGHWILK